MPINREMAKWWYISTMEYNVASEKLNTTIQAVIEKASHDTLSEKALEIQ